MGLNRAAWCADKSPGARRGKIRPCMAPSHLYQLFAKTDIQPETSKMQPVQNLTQCVEDYATVDLPSRTAKTNATEGQPEEANLWVHDDGRITCGVWECTPGSFPSAKTGVSEFMTFIAGDATIFDDDGTTHVVGPGVALFLNDGWTGRWEIRKTVRKTYTIVKTGDGNG